ncbi:hypothetical protein B0H17DRAFT_1061526 [Mycena rosella]|uniref:Uncharacterized protein n=1 Tax=Mycena rosella TaxID=1033263 RepID=A0AAD7DKQ7_MYCRO|nr:hypothetical protein B0H17DRAFT_1061526 [Mycena rosella]
MPDILTPLPPLAQPRRAADTLVPNAIGARAAYDIDTGFEVRPTPASRITVKITPWRLFNVVVVLSLGIYKATATYLGQPTALTTLDWIIGVVWALMYVPNNPYHLSANCFARVTAPIIRGRRRGTG